MYRLRKGNGCRRVVGGRRDIDDKRDTVDERLGKLPDVGLDVMWIL